MSRFSAKKLRELPIGTTLTVMSCCERFLAFKIENDNYDDYRPIRVAILLDDCLHNNWIRHYDVLTIRKKSVYVTEIEKLNGNKLPIYVYNDILFIPEESIFVTAKELNLIVTNGFRLKKRFEKFRLGSKQFSTRIDCDGDLNIGCQYFKISKVNKLLKEISKLGFFDKVRK